MSLLKKLAITAVASAAIGTPVGCMAERMLEEANEDNSRHYGFSDTYTPPLTLLVPLAFGGALLYKVGNAHFEKKK